MTYAKVDLTKYIVLSIWFGCNNNCTICMLSGMKEALPPIDFEDFKRVIMGVRDDGRYENLILSGAEVTTFDDLEKYVRFAASLGWFKKIQIQTNGRRLGDKEYLRRLVGWGVNEFFISIHGLKEVHDTITQAPGSFEETLKGLKNLQDHDVNVISNTVLTRVNLHDIPRLMTLLSRERVSEIHVWNFFPMERRDTKNLVVSMRSFVPLLSEVLGTLRSAGKALVLKSFPECLAAGEPGFFDSLFPVTVLPGLFWRQFGESGFGACVHRERCKAWQCWGLSSAYIHRYGDERDLLRPVT
jgi:MoaA/NifB/PqqE/SkfB family radical SAM enzyme